MDTANEPNDPHTGGCGCAKCSSSGSATAVTTTWSPVYALGRIEARFPSLAVEKEFAQATTRLDSHGKTDRQTLHAVLEKKENRYLARQLCWVFNIAGLETYVLRQREPGDLRLLVEAIRPMPRPTDIDVVIGLQGPIAPAAVCNGLRLPIVVFEQIYSFDIDSVVKTIPKPAEIPQERFAATVEELFQRIGQLADNTGATDRQRALNYLVVRYPAIYALAAEAFGRSQSLTAVDVRPSPLSNVRKVLDVIFSFTHRTTEVTEKFFLRVDVTEPFPFLVTKLSPYYDR